MGIDPDSVVSDPQVRTLLDMLKSPDRVAYKQITPARARRQFTDLCRKTRKLPARTVDAQDVRLADGAASLSGRLFRPRAAGPERLPVLVYFHGGGFCMGDLDTHDPACRQIAEEAGCAVLSVAYRLAPEHRFPAAVEDACTSLGIVARHGQSLGLDTSLLAVGGDSAGGNLATVSTIAARHRDLRPVAQVLIYPVTDVARDYESQDRYSDGFGLTREAIDWFVGNYIDPAHRSDWRASPVYAADLSGLPPALIIVGEFDPLVDQAGAYADALRRAGTAVRFHIYPGMIHGFITMGGVIDAADRAIAETAGFLKAAFAARPQAMSETVVGHEASSRAD